MHRQTTRSVIIGFLMEPNFRFRSVDGNGHHSETEPHHRNWEMKIVQKVGQEVSRIEKSRMNLQEYP